MRGVPPPVCCLPILLSGCLPVANQSRAWLSRSWGTTEGFARWGQLK